MSGKRKLYRHDDRYQPKERSGDRVNLSKRVYKSPRNVTSKIFIKLILHVRISINTSFKFDLTFFFRLFIVKVGGVFNSLN